MEEILTAEQVAQILQVHQFTVLKFIKQGKLKASKLGRVYRIRKSDVDAFLDSQVEKAEEKASKKTENVKRTVKKESKKTEIATSPPDINPEKRIEGRATPESETGFEPPVKTPPEHTDEPRAEIDTTPTYITDIPERDDRRDIDHYVIELKTN